MPEAAAPPRRSPLKCKPGGPLSASSLKRSQMTEQMARAGRELTSGIHQVTVQVACILAREGGTYCCTSSLQKNAPCERDHPLLSSEPLFTLRSKAHIARSSSKSKGVAYAVKRPPSHEGGDPRSGVPWEHASVLHHGTGGRRTAETRPASGDDSRLGALLSRRTCQNRICRPT